MELQKQIAKSILEINWIWKRTVIRRQAEAGLKQDTMLYARILNYVKKHENEEVFQKDIERDEALNKSTVSMILSNLEKEGLLERHNMRRDARLKRIKLTKKGEETYVRLNESLSEIDTAFTDGISEEEQETLLRLLAKVKENLKNRS